RLRCRARRRAHDRGDRRRRAWRSRRLLPRRERRPGPGRSGRADRARPLISDVDQLASWWSTAEPHGRWRAMDSEALRRADEATFVEEVIEPLAWAAIHDRAFCRSMGDESRAVATLWTLAVQVFRNGLFYFVED